MMPNLEDNRGCEGWDFGHDCSISRDYISYRLEVQRAGRVRYFLSLLVS